MLNESKVVTDCRALKDALLRATRPMLVVGYGAVLAGAAAEVLLMANRLPQLRVAATPKAKGIFPESHPQYVGVIGFAGHEEARQYLFERADYVVIVGSRLGELTSNNWDCRWHTLNAAHIDIADQPASWFRASLFIRADARRLLCALVAALPNVNTRVIDDVRCSHRQLPLIDLDKALEPKDVIQLVNRSLPSDAHVFSGIGNTMAWAVHYLRLQKADRWHVNLCAGAMGHAIPAAIGAALTGATAVALVGDAEFLMTGYELHTAIENDVSLCVVVLNDAGHGMVRVGSQVHCKGMTPSFDFLEPVDVVAAGRAQGAYAVSAETAREFMPTFVDSLARPGPTVINVPIARGLVPPLGARLDSLSHAFGIGKEPVLDVHK